MLTQEKLVKISRPFGVLPGRQPAMEHMLEETRRMQSALLKTLTSGRRQAQMPVMSACALSQSSPGCYLVFSA